MGPDPMRDVVHGERSNAVDASDLAFHKSIIQHRASDLRSRFFGAPVSDFWRGKVRTRLRRRFRVDKVTAVLVEQGPIRVGFEYLDSRSGCSHLIASNGLPRGKA